MEVVHEVLAKQHQYLTNRPLLPPVFDQQAFIEAVEVAAAAIA